MKRFKCATCGWQGVMVAGVHRCFSFSEAQALFDRIAGLSTEATELHRSGDHVGAGTLLKLISSEVRKLRAAFWMARK